MFVSAHKRQTTTCKNDTSRTKQNNDLASNQSLSRTILTSRKPFLNRKTDNQIDLERQSGLN